MHLTDASVVLRPRSAWEAVDLGLLLARKHSALLLISQALVTLPVFALISLCLWQHPAYAYLLFWWLKPLYERLPLYILSRALFGQTPRLKEALRALPTLLGQQLFASLLWRRFSLWRSFAQPLAQLEGLQGKARRERLRILGQKDSATASGLTLLGVHIELLLWLGLCLLLVFLLLPQQLWALDDDLPDILLAIKNWILPDKDSRLHYHLSNLAYALVLVFWQPIYAACGFTLYLNYPVSEPPYPSGSLGHRAKISRPAPAQNGQYLGLAADTRAAGRVPRPALARLGTGEGIRPG